LPIWLAALFGLVQGLTEFLPVSSTAHLRILPALLGRPDAGAAFTAVLQLGTLAAVVFYFRRDLWAMARGVFREPKGPDARLAGYLVLGTIPIGLAGVTLKRYVVGDLRSLWVVAGALAVVGVIMALVDRRAKQARPLDEIGWRDALLIGIGQACALVPGVSRSGATLIVALLLGFTRWASARFSFLLSIPALLAAGLFELDDAMVAFSDPVPLLVGTLVATIVGYLSIAWLLHWLRTRTLVSFAAYRIALAALVLVALAG
jgi:undecaprenyl-diphosphatase